MTLVQGTASTAIRAFVRESGSKSQGSAEVDMTLLGQVPKGLYVYIGPVKPEAKAGDQLIFQGKILELRRTELVVLGDEAVYCWGLCVEKGEESQWGELQ